MGSPLAAAHFVDDDDRILLDDHVRSLGGGKPYYLMPSFELAGPRRKIYFDPSKTRVGIVTCGGLCPGLNDVVRGLVMECHYRYGIRKVYGFRYGYQGFIAERGHDVIELGPKDVSNIHEDGGSYLGSSRGKQDIGQIIACLDRMGINIFFVIGGDGTIRGALAISDEIQKQNLRISVIGIPKTIDNDIQYIDQSFGFETAYTKAVEAIITAHNEAHGAPNGVGLVKLMGRESGFIACHAALATCHVNYVLVPEVPFKMEGAGGFLNSLQKRLEARNHAVIVAAEGAGQDLIPCDHAEFDASGNRKLGDIGKFLCTQIRDHFQGINMEVNLKYIDPSYMIRGVPAIPPDSVFCWRLAQNAVHAAMAGKTRMLIGQWHGRLVHVPMKQAIIARKKVDPDGEIWLSVLEATGQPPIFS